MTWVTTILLAFAALPAGVLLGAIIGMLVLRSISAVKRQLVRR